MFCSCYQIQLCVLLKTVYRSFHLISNPSPVCLSSPDAGGCRSLWPDPAQLFWPGQNGLHDGVCSRNGCWCHVWHFLLSQVNETNGLTYFSLTPAVIYLTSGPINLPYSRPQTFWIEDSPFLYSWKSIPLKADCYIPNSDSHCQPF